MWALKWRNDNTYLAELTYQGRRNVTAGWGDKHSAVLFKSKQAAFEVRNDLWLKRDVAVIRLST